MAGAGTSEPGTFGPYRILGLLGNGAMGHVYRALAPDGSDVALKVMRSELSRDATYRARFELEARIARRLDHPAVVPVLDAGALDGAVYMVQRFIDGISLEQHLDAAGPLAIDQSVRIVSEVAEGLDAIAAAGIVHRDVKPGNVLLDRAMRAHVTDLGLAKDLDGPALTRPGQALGSMDYMAPEQIRVEALSATADVYGLACLAFACLVGRPPFGDRPPMRVMVAHLEEVPPTAAELRPEVPDAVSEAIAGALAKDPAARPASAGELAAALRAGVN